MNSKKVVSSCLAYMLRSRRLNTGWACCLQHSVAPCWAGQHLSASEDAHRVHRPISIAPEQSALTLHSLHPAFAYHTVSERMTPTSAACKWVVRVWRKGVLSLLHGRRGFGSKAQRALLCRLCTHRQEGRVAQLDDS